MDALPPVSDEQNSIPASTADPSGAYDLAGVAALLESPPAEEREVPVEFHGTGSEYFKIWIVNTALSILTLGIYSAWAKVRSRRYFYGNTRIEGSSLEYLAKPKQILLGRILVGACLIAVLISSRMSMRVYWILIGAIVLASPWIVVKALRFNARYSAFRNIRFSFDGTTEGSYWIYFLLPLLCIATLGLGIPYMEKSSRSWRFSNHRYGNQGFRDSLTDGQVYAIYFKMLGLAALVSIPAVVIYAAVIAGRFSSDDSSPPPTTVVIWLAGAAYALMLIVGAFLGSYKHVQLSNLLFNGGRLGRIVEFRSTLRTGTYCGLMLGYGILTIVTLGLAFPWMRVALARYRAANLVLRMRGALDDIVGEMQRTGSAIADQFAEGLDLDIDLGF